MQKTGRKKESPSATNARDFPRTDRFEPIQYLDRMILYHMFLTDCKTKQPFFMLSVNITKRL